MSIAISENELSSAAGNLRMDADFVALLRCPATGKPLTLSPAGLESGERLYPVVDGVPVLIANDRSVFQVESRQSWADSSAASPGAMRWIVNWIDRFLPSLEYDRDCEARQAHLVSLLRNMPERPRILVVGGGDSAALKDQPNMYVIDSDVFISEKTDVVCDGHDLPFVDECFDAVVAIAVLEHVVDPPRVVEEMTRVLKMGGIVYSDIPFLQHVHLGAQDFTRYTLLGHRGLFRQFETIRCEPSTGPISSLLWSVEGVMLALFSRNRTMWRLASRATRLAFGWLSFLDRWLIDLPGASDAACGTVFVGRKQVDGLDDRALIAEYRGAYPTPNM
jgi:SAM-dependent methyltransferase